ncbi:glycosyl hydrolase 108 family protein [Halomonas sp. SSL-5]|uniref:glycoside hydrolase family 108 protein n=1 Tax=Halomonas sp. SSL-5 TaxID=3065855 RepID=UPI0027388311|nr:glycosyl hydrolase 108 family protein [Halomonas sp. SSL-5]MDY7116589.1 glycosyl hydrolase 108 family protein [Halomonas sp. SSL-5]
MHPIQKRLIDEVIDREGGYVNHPADRGGPTRYGITEAVAREHGYRGDMRELPIETAAEIYAARYWHPNRLERIVTLSGSLAVYMFDYGVHSGTGRPARDLQRLLNVLNRQERDYDDIAVDGMVGPATLAALRAYLQTRGPDGMTVLAESLNSLRKAFLVELSENRESQEAFTYGWLHRVLSLRDDGGA